MIDFANGSFVKLSHIAVEAADPAISRLLVDGEQILFAAKGIRDSVVFTNKRIIACNVQGMTGKKVDFTSLPYAKMSAFSVETGGTFDLDAEVSVWLSGVGAIKFDFTRGTDVTYLSKLLAHTIL